MEGRWGMFDIRSFALKQNIQIELAARAALAQLQVVSSASNLQIFVWIFPLSYYLEVSFKSTAYKSDHFPVRTMIYETRRVGYPRSDIRVEISVKLRNNVQFWVIFISLWPE